MFAISVPNYPNSNVETPFLGQFYICLLLVVNSNKYLSYVVDNVIFGISVPDYPIEPLKAILSHYFGILYILFTLYS